MARITTRRIQLISLAIVGLFFFSITGMAQIENDGFVPEPNSDVQDITMRSDGRILVAGWFLGSRPRLALIRNDGVTDIGFNANVSDGAVFAATFLQDGKLIVGGSFNSIGGASHPRLARLTHLGSIDPAFTASPNDIVRTVCVQADQKIVIAGDFTSVSGVSRNRIARLNSDGTVDTSFDPNSDATIAKVVCDNRTGKIYVAGFYNNIGGAAKRIVRLNANGTADPTFNVVLPNNPWAASFGIQNDGKIVVGHSSGIVRVNTNGSIDPTLNHPTGSWVTAIALEPNGDILFGGFFTSVAGVARNRVARLYREGNVDLGFDPNVSSAQANNINIHTIARQFDGSVLIGGRFQTVRGVTRNCIARVHPGGILDDHSNPNFGGGPVAVIAAANSAQWVVAGNMTSMSGHPISGITKLNSGGQRLTSFNTPSFTGGWINSVVAEPNNRTLVGGDFTSVGGDAARKHLVRLVGFGELDTTFNVTLNGSVLGAARLLNGQYLIGGIFSNVNSNARGYLARINENGTLDTTFNASANFWVDNFAVQADGKIIVGGYFTTMNGVARIGLARLNADGTLDTAFNPVLGGTLEPSVNDIVIQPDGKILIAGSFSTVNGASRTFIARLNSDGTLDTAFNAVVDSIVLSMALDRTGNVLIGGRFLNVNGQARAHIMRLHSNGASDAFFAANADDVVLSVAVQTDGKALAGGYFSTINGTTRNRMVRLRSMHASQQTIAATQNSVTLTQVGSSPALTRVNFLTSSNGVDWTHIGTGTPDPFLGTWTVSGVAPQQFVRAYGYGRDHSGTMHSFDISGWFPSVQPLPGSNVPFDFDGDRKSDVGIFRQPGEWWIQNSGGNSVTSATFGAAGDILVPADYTGDGRADQAVWRPSTGEWFVQRSGQTSYYSFIFGSSGDIPMPADFDGDGKADVAVFRPSTATWYIGRSSDGQTSFVQFGASGDQPIAADYDGDGKSDIAIFRPADGSWWILRSTDNQTTSFAFGIGTDRAVPGDYTGDGKADAAVWRPSTGQWFFLRSETNQYYSFTFGVTGDIPAPADYDGDGKFDVAVFRPSQGVWYISATTAGSQIFSFGLAGDRPIPNAFVR